MIHLFSVWQFRFGVPIGKRAEHAVQFGFDSCNLLWISAGRDELVGTWINIGPFQLSWY